MSNAPQPSLARSFEDLWIWQRARELVCEVYQDFTEGTPGCRDFGFRNRMQSAAVSIMNNIAEGFERESDADFARFLTIAKASCGEVRSMYYLAEDLGYVSHETADSRRGKARGISSGIAAFRNRLTGASGA
ncbi:MAG: four helix bundle protein [Planctomycetaceae bacterium]|nr:four helix bundle protein [Planctomycetaceae bacterium]